MRRKPWPWRRVRSAASKWRNSASLASGSKPSADRRARASSGDKRQRAREAGPAGGLERVRDLEDRLCRLRLRVGEDERDAAVGGLAEPHVERHPAEQPHAELGGEAVAAAGAEHLRTHVLDDA